MQFQKNFKHQRQNKWKDPFQVIDTPPIVLKEMVVGEEKERGEMKFEMRFTKEALERYDDLNKSADFMAACKGRDACLKLLDLLTLDIQMLLSCDHMAMKGQSKIREDSPASQGLERSVLQEAPSDADRSPDPHGDSGPAKDSQPEKAADYLFWLPYNPTAVKWTEQGLTDPNVFERSNFFPACAFFFYIEELAKAHPAINNALHKAWLEKFKKPMSAEDLDEPPVTFNDQAKNWYKETIKFLQDKLTEVQRGLRGLPLKARACRTKATAQTAALERAATNRAVVKRRARAESAGSDSSSGSDSEFPTTKVSEPTGRCTFSFLYCIDIHGCNILHIFIICNILHRYAYMQYIDYITHMQYIESIFMYAIYSIYALNC